MHNILACKPIIVYRPSGHKELMPKNSKNLPVIKECKILKNSEDNVESYKEEMQKILNLAAKNAVNPNQKLFRIV
ncbi:MAG: hypothetical protein ACRBBZ_07705 [Nitrosopumilus sp.]